MTRQIANQTHQQKSTATPSASVLLQRNHDFGYHAVAGGELEAYSNNKRPGLQTQLTINEPGDICEQEADWIADQVMAMPVNPKVGGMHRSIRRLSGGSTGQKDTVPASVDQALASPGRPLESSLRQDMEQRFGYDFSRVRVHTGAAAEQSAKDMSACAYALGRDVFFGAGQFAPWTQLGRKVLVHELAHVVQQTGSQGIYQDQDHEKRDLSALPFLNDVKSKLIMRFVHNLPQDWSFYSSSRILFSLRYKFLRNGHTILDRAFTSLSDTPRISLPPGRYTAKIIGTVSTQQGADSISDPKLRRGLWTCRMEWPVVVNSQGMITIDARGGGVEGGGGSGTWSIVWSDITDRVGVELQLSSTASTTTTYGGEIGGGGAIGGSIGREYQRGGTHFGLYTFLLRLQGEPAPEPEPEIIIGEAELVSSKMILLTIQGFPEGSAHFPGVAADEMFSWFARLPDNLKRSIRNGETRVFFEGHASTTEGESVNIDISRLRAQHVMDTFGGTVASTSTALPSSLQFYGVGEEEAQCQGVNCPHERRVDVIVSVSRFDLEDLSQLPNQGRATIDFGRR